MADLGDEIERGHGALGFPDRMTADAGEARNRLMGAQQTVGKILPFEQGRSTMRDRAHGGGGFGPTSFVS